MENKTMKHYLLLIFLLLQTIPTLGMHADKEEIEGAYRAYKEDPKKFSKKLEVLKKFAARGGKELNNPLAQYYLGLVHENGIGFGKDVDEAVEYFYDAALNGHTEAFIRLKSFADKENLFAQFYIGDLYYKGRGVNKILEKAAEYDLKAARKEEAHRDAVLERTQEDKEYERVIKRKECEYVNNREGPLEQSFGRIALFRGIHYVTNLFGADAITTNRGLNDIDAFLVSSAACALTGKEFLAGIPGEAELKAGKLVYKILKKFKAEAEFLYNKFHETYTNDHEQFHSCLGIPEKGKDTVTQNAFKHYRWVFQNFAERLYPNTWQKAVQRNPFVSFACNAQHGLKYAMGQKSFTGGDKVKLSAEYNEKGEPKNKYLGKLYTAILSPADVWKLNPTFVVDKHAKNKVEITTHPTNNILTENEVSFFGYVPKGFVKASHVLEMKNLSKDEKRNYKKVNQDFNTTKGKATQIIDDKSPQCEIQADELIEKARCLRLYPDIFENYYTDISDTAGTLKTANWLHSINGKNPNLASSPIQGEGGATKSSIHMLATHLARQPFNLDQTWASCLKRVCISFCDLGDSGTSFVRILKNSKIPLEKLSLTSCQLTKNDTKIIASSLIGNRYLRNLILDNNTVQDEGAKEFASSLKKNNSLQELSLYDTGIKDISCFAELFPTGGHEKSLNKTLTELKLNSNLNDQNLKKIQKGLNRNLK